MSAAAAPASPEGGDLCLSRWKRQEVEELGRCFNCKQCQMLSYGQHRICGQKIISAYFAVRFTANTDDTTGLLNLSKTFSDLLYQITKIRCSTYTLFIFNFHHHHYGASLRVCYRTSVKINFSVQTLNCVCIFGCCWRWQMDTCDWTFALYCLKKKYIYIYIRVPGALSGKQ